MVKFKTKATAAEKAEINRRLAERGAPVFQILHEFGWNNVVRAQTEYYRKKKKDKKQFAKRRPS